MTEPETAPEATPAPPASKYRVRTEDPAMRWYVVHTLTGHEQKVKGAVERVAEEQGMGDYILNVLVPSEEVATQTKRGKGMRRRIFFPGYIIVQMKVTEQSWALVRRTSGVTGFVSTGATPSPLAEDEVQIIIDQMEGRKPRVEVTINFEEGDPVHITAGPFVNFSGVAEEIYPDRGKAKVMVTIFGRATAVELDVAEVEKAR